MQIFFLYFIKYKEINKNLNVKQSFKSIKFIFVMRALKMELFGIFVSKFSVKPNFNFRRTCLSVGHVSVYRVKALNYSTRAVYQQFESISSINYSIEDHHL